jgi:hypothetical protein
MRVPLFVSTALLAATTAAHAEPAPQSSAGAPDREPVGEIQMPPAPATAPIPATLHVRGSELRELRPDPRYHRGGTYTDAGEEMAGELTGYETDKLELARAAVEASRNAGTLYSTRIPENAVAPGAEDLEDMKRVRLESHAAPELADDPVAGIGTGLPSVQEIGPSDLTAAEIAKRDAGDVHVTEPEARDEETVGAPPAPPAGPRPIEPRDGTVHDRPEGE